jgi:hypothetical protein
MDLNLPVTIGIVVVVLILFAFANWRSRKPADPLNLNMIKVNYHVIQMVCIVVLLYMTAHLITLLTGRPFTGQGGSF